MEDFLATTPDSKALVKVDAVYGGDFAKWLKFARSLKLRLAMRIRYVEPDLALQYAQEAIEAGSSPRRMRMPCCRLIARLRSPIRWK